VAVQDHEIKTSQALIPTLSVTTIVVSVIDALLSFVGAVITITGASLSTSVTYIVKVSLYIPHLLSSVAILIS
jgi:hypothetical protein